MLFSLYLNDLQSYLEENGLFGLESISRDSEVELTIYIKILFFLYADDKILLAESSKELQQMLDHFSNYCDQWKLKINVEKNQNSYILRRSNFKQGQILFKQQRIRNCKKL